MTDPIWRELREHAGRIKASDLKPLAPGLGWVLKPKTVPSVRRAPQAQPHHQQPGSHERTDLPPQTTGTAGGFLAAENKTPTLASGLTRDMELRVTQAGKSQQDMLSEKPPRRFSGQRGLLRRSFFRLLAITADIIFILFTALVLLLSVRAFNSQRIPNPEHVLAFFSDRFFPLFSLREWIFGVLTLFFIYFFLFRLLAGATLAEAIFRIRRYR